MGTCSYVSKEICNTCVALHLYMQVRWQGKSCVSHAIRPPLIIAWKNPGPRYVLCVARHCNVKLFTGVSIHDDRLAAVGLCLMELLAVATAGVYKSQVLALLHYATVALRQACRGTFQVEFALNVVTGRPSAMAAAAAVEQLLSSGPCEQKTGVGLTRDTEFQTP